MIEAALNPSRVRQPLAWLAAFTALYIGLAALLYPDRFFLNLVEFTSDFLLAALTLCALGLLGAGIVQRPAAPLSHVADILRSRGLGALAIGTATCLGMAAFWTFKYHIPEIVPFFADEALARFDELLHLGDPWRWLHSITPDSVVGPLLVVYFPLWLFQFFGGVSLAALHPDDQLRTRYLLSFAIMMAGLGTVLAAASASVGPIFYDRFIEGGRFAELSEALNHTPSAGVTFAIADRLYSAYLTGAQDSFVGISAMPSIHVAVATLNALFLRCLHLWLGLVGWVFLGLTLFGSVYFGWHYASDGYVSILAVISIWRLTERYVTID